MKAAAEIGQAILDRLLAQAETNRRAGLELEEEIRAAMAAYQGRERLTAKRILAKLARRPLPSIRTVQEHLRALRKSGC